MGDLYPCHQFVGEDDFCIGNVFEGIKKQEIVDEFKLCNEEATRNAYEKGETLGIYYDGSFVSVPSVKVCSPMVMHRSLL